MRLVAIGAAPVGIVVVVRVLQRLRNDVVLKGNVAGAAAHRSALPRTAGLVHRPTDRAVVNHRMRRIPQSNSIHRLLAEISQPAADKPHDNVAATGDTRPPLAEANPL